MCTIIIVDAYVHERMRIEKKALIRVNKESKRLYLWASQGHPILHMCTIFCGGCDDKINDCGYLNLV